MKRLYALLGALPLAMLAACFSPDYGATGFSCSQEGDCPSGYECRNDGLCHRKGSPIDEPDASTIDADPNAPDADPNAPDADPDTPDADTSTPDADPGSPDADVGVIANDVCGDAELLLEGATSVGTLDAATNDDDYSCGSGSRAEVFYAFTIGQDRKVTLTLGSVFDTTLVLLDTDCSTERACSNASALGESIIEENLAAGTYFVAVESSTGASGSFTIQFDTEAPIVRPPNDDCDGIIQLTDGVTRVGETAALALDDVSPSCGGASTSDVVYEFTLPVAANRRAIVTVSNAVGFDPALMLTQGGCPGTELACAQDSDGDSEILDVGDLSPGTYSVWVDADGAAPSTFDIRLDLLAAVPAPSNDTCSAPASLTEGVVDLGSTTGASDDNDLVCLAFDSRETVHELSLAADAALLVTLEPLTDWALAASLRDAASCDVVADVSCIDGAFATRFINRPNQAAGTYDVLVDGVGGDHGDYEIRYETRAADAGFGYWQFTTSGTYAPLATGATSIPIATSDDEEQFAVTLPFEFPFFGALQTALTIHTNGFLSFDAVPTGLDSSVINNDCDLDATSPFNMIAPFWEDLKAQLEGTTTLKHQVQGTAPYRRFVIEWANWDIFESSPCQGTCDILGANVSHQAILHENGDIEFRYGPRTAPTSTVTGCETQETGCSATIGLRNTDGTDNDQAGCDTDGLVGDGTVHYFVHPS